MIYVHSMSRGPARVIPTGTASVSMKERIAVCSACQWNVNWICEHPGCRPCPARQRAVGGLSALLPMRVFRCPIGKF